MEILSVLFKSGLSESEVQKKFEDRAEKYRHVDGLIQKYYIHDEDAGQFGGIYVFDSKENLEAFRNSDLAKGIGDAYQYIGPPTIREYRVTYALYEEKKRIRT